MRRARPPAAAQGPAVQAQSAGSGPCGWQRPSPSSPGCNPPAPPHAASWLPPVAAPLFRQGGPGDAQGQGRVAAAAARPPPAWVCLRVSGAQCPRPERPGRASRTAGAGRRVLTAGLAGGEGVREGAPPSAGPTPCSPDHRPGETDGAMWGAPEALQLPLSLEQGWVLSPGRTIMAWGEGRNKGQRKSGGWKETGPGEQGLAEATLPRLSPSTGVEEANPGGRMGPLASR